VSSRTAELAKVASLYIANIHGGEFAVEFAEEHQYEQPLGLFEDDGYSGLVGIPESASRSPSNLRCRYLRLTSGGT
jgi:hypothetical protein